MNLSFSQPVVCPVLVGRAPELAALERLVERACTGQGTTVLIAGEAGIGKSRLVAEMAGRARQRGNSVLAGHCFESDVAVPYAPIVDLLRALPSDRSTIEVARAMGSVADDLVKLVPELAAFLSARTTTREPVTSVLDPEWERRRLFDTLVLLLSQLAAIHPLFVVIEDLHWSDDTSLDFLLHLARRVTGHRILLMLTYREDDIRSGLTHFLASLDREHVATELHLARLSPTDVETMCRAILADHGMIPNTLVHELIALTEGNPFFIEETLKDLLLVSDLARGGATTHESPRAWRVPRSVQDAVQRRAERLSPAARHVLALAAVVGRRFDFGLLQTLAGLAEDELLSRLKELVAAQLVVELSADQFGFRHALTRQAVYAQMLARERRSLHRAVAETLECLNGGVQDAHLSELAFHTFAAEAWQHALVYARRAGERAQTLHAPREAVEQFTRALRAAGYLGISVPVEVHLARGHSYETLGDLERARADFETALELASVAEDVRTEWRALLDLGDFWAARDYARAGDALRRALDRARTLGDPISLAHTLNRLGNWLANTGRPSEAAQAHLEALALFEAADDRPGVAPTVDLLGMATVFCGDRVAAVGYFDRAVGLFRALGDRRGLASCLAGRSFAAGPYLTETTNSACWPLSRCLRDADKATEIARTIDWPAGLAFISLGAGHTCVEFGEYGMALAWSRETLRIATDIGHHQWLAAANSALGAVCMHLLLPERAIEHFETALALAREVGSAWWIGQCTVGLVMACLLKGDDRRADSVLAAASPPNAPLPVGPRTLIDRRFAWAKGELALRRGDPAGALRIAEDLLASVPGEPLPRPVPALDKLRGESLAALGRLDEATDALAQAQRGAAERDLRPLLWRVHAALGRVHERRKRPLEARRDFGAARELIGVLAATIPEDADREHFRAAALATLPPERPPSALRAERQAYGGLTRREREVATLIARGKSNREIATALFVGEGTVATHVSNILGKLDGSSRAQIAAWAAERGLASRA